MYKIICLFVSVHILSSLTHHAFGQLTIKGPNCVLPNTIYQYNIEGKFDTASNLKICLKGGMFDSTSATCTNQKSSLLFVRVNWNNGSSGSITVTNSKLSQIFNVIITSPLSGGSIIDTSKAQVINYNSMAATIHCSASNGGSCSPVYTYQWQESLDQLLWNDIINATGQNLSFLTSSKQPKYYRRRVIETKSGSVQYSEIAYVFPINQIPAGTSL